MDILQILSNLDNQICYNECVLRGKMMKNYIISEKTLAVIGISKEVSKVVEENDTFLVEKCWQEILNDSCLYYSSSFQGRVEGSKIILHRDYKVPIIVQEYGSLIFLPVGNQTDFTCSWVSLKKIENYAILSKEIRLFFKGNKDLFIASGKSAFESQLLMAYTLEKILNSRYKNLVKY